MRRRLAAMLVLALCALPLMLPAATMAQDPFGPIAPQVPTPLPEPEQTRTDPNKDELSSGQLALIGLGALGLIVLIGAIISRDARKSAKHVGHAASGSLPSGRPGGQRKPAEKARERAKVKAARRQRRRSAR